MNCADCGKELPHASTWIPKKEWGINGVLCYRCFSKRERSFRLKCPNCGFEVDEESGYCSKCGFIKKEVLKVKIDDCRYGIAASYLSVMIGFVAFIFGFWFLNLGFPNTYFGIFVVLTSFTVAVLGFISSDYYANRKDKLLKQLELAS